MSLASSSYFINDFFDEFLEYKIAEFHEHLRLLIFVELPLVLALEDLIKICECACA